MPGDTSANLMTSHKIQAVRGAESHLGDTERKSRHYSPVFGAK